MSAFAQDCVVNVNKCFHAEALSNNPMRKVAEHSLHYPIDVAKASITLVTSHLLEGEWGSKLCNKVQDTDPEFPGFGISFTIDVSRAVD